MPLTFYASRGTWTIAALLLLAGSAPALQAQEGSPPAGPPYRVEGNVQRPEKISGNDPVYPEIARKARVAGVVTLETLIDEQGNVTDIKVVKGLTLGLTEAAVEAVRTWKFKPATLDGQPVPVYYTLTIHFEVDGGSDFGPHFTKYLEGRPKLRALLEDGLYQEATEYLDAVAREAREPEIQLARAYLFLAQGRLKNAWKEAQAYRGPEPYEIFHRIGAAAWDQARDHAQDRRTRGKNADLGIEAETQALAAREDSFEAIAYKSLLLREKANLVPTANEILKLVHEADRLQDQALELQKEGKAEGMTLAPAAMRALSENVDPASATTLDGVVTRPERISGTYPEIPETARKAGVSGAVIIEALIDEQGNVQDARVVRGLHPDLDQAALDAIRTWKFTPAMHKGKPVKVHYNTTMNFR